MNKPLLAAAAAVSMFAMPAMAQDMSHGMSHGMNHELNEAQTATYMALNTTQRAAFDGWPHDRQMGYLGWPENVRTYYWTLDDERTTAWWMLNDEQRVRLFEMQPGQRETAWGSIMSQVNGTPAAASATTTTSTMPTNAQMRYVRNATVQSIPARTTTGEYPICTSDADDYCINPEAVRRGR